MITIIYDINNNNNDNNNNNTLILKSMKNSIFF